MSISGVGCGSLDRATKVYMFEYQNLDYDTTSVLPIIVINDWYTALETTRNVKGWYLLVEQTNNGAAVETIVTELTIGGTVYTNTDAAAASGVLQYMYLDTDGVLQNQATARQLLSLDDDQSAPLETRSLQIRVRQTTAVDAVAAQIDVNMNYAILTAT